MDNVRKLINDKKENINNDNLKKDVKQNKSEINKIKQEKQEEIKAATDHTNYTLTRILNKVIIPLITKTVINHHTATTYEVLLRHTTELCQQLIPIDLPINSNNINTTETDISTTDESSSDEEDETENIINNENKVYNNV